jgi:hypothetical protein
VCWPSLPHCLGLADGLPAGLANIVTSVSEGIRNAPKLYGSTVRPVGPITDFESGMREGGKVSVPG